MIYVMMYVQDSINIFFNPGHEIMEKWRECRSITRFYNFFLLSSRDKSTTVLVLETQKPNMNHKSRAIK